MEELLFQTLADFKNNKINGFHFKNVFYKQLGLFPLAEKVDFSKAQIDPFYRPILEKFSNYVQEELED